MLSHNPFSGLDRTFVNGAFGPSRHFIQPGVCHAEVAKHRHVLVGLSRHPPPSQFQILPSGQTLTYSSHHLSCLNQELVQHCKTDIRLDVDSYSAMMLLTEDEGGTGVVIVYGAAYV